MIAGTPAAWAFLTTTEDYRHGAIGGPALGHGLIHNRFKEIARSRRRARPLPPAGSLRLQLYPADSVQPACLPSSSRAMALMVLPSVFLVGAVRVTGLGVGVVVESLVVGVTGLVTLVGSFGSQWTLTCVGLPVVIHAT